MIQLKRFLEHQAYFLRVNSLVMTTKAGSGHPTSCLSAADLVAALFFHAMHFDPKHFDNPNNDHFILSKGHAAPLLYAAWQEVGVIPETELYTYREITSPLEGHPTLRFPYAEAATGSLGQGLSIGAGMALAGMMDQRPFRTYVIMGDSELSEGSIWEAAELSAYYKLDHLIGIVDCNGLGQTGETMHGHHADRYAKKFEAFGWDALVIDGHDMLQIIGALDKVQKAEGRPTVIIAKTIKGYGVARAENKNGFHGHAFKPEELNEILQELETRFHDAATYDEDYEWMPKIPEADNKKEKSCPLTKTVFPHYQLGEMVETRRAYGQALAACGKNCETIVSLDAEVSNSTFAEIFEHSFPERFVQCFIAEQNMVGMGVGMERRGKIPYVSTFSCFLSRAHDQLRMAAIGSSNLRVVGSHAGVSIGQDGPSQMGLEDIAMMRTLPGSIILYPADAVCTCQLVYQMAEYNQGISYLRTTRMKTPVIYGKDEEFVIGGCKVLRSSDEDVACIIAAGITLFEALKAYDDLYAKGIHVAVIDLYSVKPLDKTTILRIARSSKNRIITVEDHYPQGGIGEAILHAIANEPIKVQLLAVNQLPRSGKPEELLHLCGIDAEAIINGVHSLD